MTELKNIRDPFVLDPELEEYATDKQWEKLLAWEEHGTGEKAGAALGINGATVYAAYKGVLKRAGRHGYDPERGHKRKTARGMVLRGTSTLHDADGTPIKQWDKTRQEGRDPEEVVQLPDPKTVVKLSTLYDQEGRVTQQWVAERPDAVAQAHAWEEFAKALAEDLPRVEPLPAPAVVEDDLMACYPVGDHHMGMLAWGVETGASWDLNIGEKMLAGAVRHLMDAAPPARVGLVVFLGDFMHYDSMEPVTPRSRNQLDADSRFPKMVRVSVRAMRHAIEEALLRHAHVHVIVEIGNHDLSSSIFLMECLANVYEREPRVSVDTSPRHFHYYRFGDCLVGTHHGHGVKMPQLPLTMAADRPDDWGQTRHRYWWTGHIHKSQVQAATSAQDFSGCTVESFRVLAAPDAWGAQQGYRPRRDMKSIVLHRRFGEVARSTVSPEMFWDGDPDALRREPEEK